MDETAKIRLWLAVAATLLAGIVGWKVSSLEWQPQAPFDVLGVLWLLSNIPGLVLWGVFAGLAILAIGAWCSFLLRRL